MIASDALISILSNDANEDLEKSLCRKDDIRLLIETYRLIVMKYVDFANRSALTEEQATMLFNWAHKHLNELTEIEMKFYPQHQYIMYSFDDYRSRVKELKAITRRQLEKPMRDAISGSTTERLDKENE